MERSGINVYCFEIMFSDGKVEVMSTIQSNVEEAWKEIMFDVRSDILSRDTLQNIVSINLVEVE